MNELTIFWFRRDLRLFDNAGLYRALTERDNVLPLFVFDRKILDQIEDKQDARVEFIHSEVSVLKSELEKRGSTLIVRYGEPVVVFARLLAEYRIVAVYANGDYEMYARERDEEIRKLLAAAGIPLFLFKDQVIFEKDEVMKDNGTPYTVFTPYMKKWKSLLEDSDLKPFPPEKHMGRFAGLNPGRMISPEEMGFRSNSVEFPSREPDENLIRNYHLTRDVPSLRGTSRLSLHLRFGTVSIRELAGKALSWNETFLNELIWREFYKMILWHFPRVESNSFKPAYDRIVWRNNEEEFDAWCRGMTGCPMVDAGMRELNETGFMHNRLRMITASFLVKHLLIDWRWGEAWFANKLHDFELSSNNGGWQWAAGSGCDAAPYFRVFNPALQQEKFDPELRYIKTRIPEYGTDAYPLPMVDHRLARDRAIAAYKKALKEPGI